MAAYHQRAELAQVKTWLLDTGPVVAYLDARDEAHHQAVQALDSFSGQLYTTSAVVTECMHFVAAQPEGPETLLEFLIAARVHIAECTSLDCLGKAVGLMRKYDGVPMDFADATLVSLAETLGVDQVCTLDQRGFTVYRMARNKRFVLVIDLP
jgi:predicted nucleic acid-binding protein